MTHEFNKDTLKIKNFLDKKFGEENFQVTSNYSFNYTGINYNSVHFFIEEKQLLLSYYTRVYDGEFFAFVLYKPDSNFIFIRKKKFNFKEIENILNSNFLNDNSNINTDFSLMNIIDRSQSILKQNLNYVYNKLKILENLFLDLNNELDSDKFVLDTNKIKEYNDKLRKFIIKNSKDEFNEYVGMVLDYLRIRLNGIEYNKMNIKDVLEIVLKIKEKLLN